MLEKIFIAFVIVFIGASIVFGLLARPQFEAKVVRANVNNAELTYYTRGEGDPIVLIPGFGMTMQHWDPELLRRLSADHQLIIFNPRGVGSSTGDLNKVTESQLADDVKVLMDKLGISKADIIGWSAGSFTAQVVAEKYPIRVNKLILISTMPGGDQSIDASKQLSAKIQQNPDKSWGEFLVPLMFVSQTEAQSYLNRLERAKKSKEVPTEPEMTEAAKAAYESAYADKDNENARLEGLEKISTPTLLITGEKDTFTPVENAVRTHARIPNATLSIIPNAGHAVLFERADIVADQIMKFIEK